MPAPYCAVYYVTHTMHRQSRSSTMLKAVSLLMVAAATSAAQAPAHPPIHFRADGMDRVSVVRDIVYKTTTVAGQPNRPLAFDLYRATTGGRAPLVVFVDVVVRVQAVIHDESGHSARRGHAPPAPVRFPTTRISTSSISASERRSAVRIRQHSSIHSPDIRRVPRCHAARPNCRRSFSRVRDKTRFPS